MQAVTAWLLGGISIGLVYALFGVGYSLMFGVMRCLNIAHAGTFVLAALAACRLSQIFPATPLGGIVVVLLCVALGAMVNLVVHAVALQPLLRRSMIKVDIEMASFLATLGAFFIIQTMAIEATEGQALSFNAELAKLGTVRVLGAPLPLKYVVVGIAALASLGGVLWLLHTAFGRRMRATADDRFLATVLGIDIRATQRLAMAVAGGLAGLGGAMIAYLYGQATYGLSESFLVKAIVISIVAGLGSLGGAVAVAVGLGLIEVATITLLGSAWRDLSSFVLVMAILALRPQGLFARRQRLAT